MFGISFLELVVIGLLALIVLGPEKLPEVARWAGKGIRELRQISNTFRDALMIDDLGGTSRKPGNPTISSAPQSSPPSKPPSPSSPSVPTASSLPPRTDSSDPLLPMGLDQIDDDHFEKLLAEQYQLHHHQLRKVTLPPRKITGETHSIGLSRARTSPDLSPVLLSSSDSLELAS